MPKWLRFCEWGTDACYLISDKCRVKRVVIFPDAKAASLDTSVFHIRERDKTIRSVLYVTFNGTATTPDEWVKDDSYVFTKVEVVAEKKTKVKIVVQDTLTGHEDWAIVKDGVSYEQ